MSKMRKYVNMFNLKKHALFFGLTCVLLYGLCTMILLINYHHTDKPFFMLQIKERLFIIMHENDNSEVAPRDKYEPMSYFRLRESGSLDEENRSIRLRKGDAFGSKTKQLNVLKKKLDLKVTKTFIKTVSFRRTTVEPQLNYSEKIIKQDYINQSIVAGKLPKKKTKTNSCPKLGLIQKYKVSLHNNISCQEHQPSEAACIYVSDLYPYNVSIRTCNIEPSVDICFYGRGKVWCSYRTCGERFQGRVYIHVFNKTTGHVEAIPGGSKNDKELNYYANKEAQKTVRRGYNFLFISCNKIETQTQLLLIDDDILKPQTGKSRKQKNGINVNVVLFDSISRAHFYRSLQKTIDTFNEINSDVHSQTEVLDFQLFQALHGHSAENNHGLFTGHVFPSNLSDSDIEEEPAGINVFIKHFKREGYDVMYQDDMCWEAFWGIRMDLGGPEEWKDLSEQIDQLELDDTGLLFAGCKILKQYDIEHTFNLEDSHKVCFNGAQQDVYYLRYLLNRHQKAEKNNTAKLFSFSNLNVAHDGGGVRVQTIDKDLSKFVSTMSRLENTLTIILADHGNTYTDYVYLDMEGRYEMFHPSLFMIIPKGVKQYIGEDMMTSLRLNQNRLFTMLDLHHTLFALTDTTRTEKGVLSPIPTNRSCSDVPLRLPNLCVCQGWNTPIQNNTELVGHLEFAVGTLNNIIASSSPGGRCKRLVPIMIHNILQKNDGNNIRTTFDFYTESGYGSKNKHETISVEVESILNQNMPTREMKLLSNDRISKFGRYKKCSDARETFRLCVCDEKTDSTKENNGNKSTNKVDALFSHRTSLTYNIFNGIVQEEQKLLKKDLAVITRLYNEPQYDDDGNEASPYIIALSFEVVNAQPKHAYYVSVIFRELGNIKPTSNNCSSVVRPQTVVYLCSIARSADTWETFYSFEFLYDEMVNF